MIVGAYRTLAEHANDHASVLRTTVLRLVVRHRLSHPVADHIDLVQRHLMLLVQVALYRLRSLEPEFLVVLGGSDVVGVTSISINTFLGSVCSRDTI
jgi:hypothetical protein